MVNEDGLTHRIEALRLRIQRRTPKLASTERKTGQKDTKMNLYPQISCNNQNRNANLTLAMFAGCCLCAWSWWMLKLERWLVAEWMLIQSGRWRIYMFPKGKSSFYAAQPAGYCRRVRTVQGEPFSVTCGGFSRCPANFTSAPHPYLYFSVCVCVSVSVCLCVCLCVRAAGNQLVIESLSLINMKRGWLLEFSHLQWCRKWSQRLLPPS